nr:hypothetical protein CFP56_13351 [Quercus suber]
MPSPRRAVTSDCQAHVRLRSYCTYSTYATDPTTLSPTVGGGQGWCTGASPAPASPTVEELDVRRTTQEMRPKESHCHPLTLFFTLISGRRAPAATAVTLRQVRLTLVELPALDADSSFPPAPCTTTHTSPLPVRRVSPPEADHNRSRSKEQEVYIPSPLRPTLFSLPLPLSSSRQPAVTLSASAPASSITRNSLPPHSFHQTTH